MVYIVNIIYIMSHNLWPFTVVEALLLLKAALGILLSTCDMSDKFIKYILKLKIILSLQRFPLRIPRPVCQDNTWRHQDFRWLPMLHYFEHFLVHPVSLRRSSLNIYLSKIQLGYGLSKVNQSRITKLSTVLNYLLISSFIFLSNNQLGFFTINWFLTIFYVALYLLFLIGFCRW